MRSLEEYIRFVFAYIASMSSLVTADMYARIIVVGTKTVLCICLEWPRRALFDFHASIYILSSEPSDKIRRQPTP